MAAAVCASGEPKVAAVILAAGESRRMGRENKLLVPLEGVPMIVRVVRAAAGSLVNEVVVVVGHECKRLEAVLAGEAARTVFNPRFREGMSTSLQRGLAAVAEDVDAIAVCLGDMPYVRSTHINRVVAAFDPAQGRGICVPTCGGQRGHPVVVGRGFFPRIHGVTGDVGARQLLSAHADAVCEIELADRAVLIDIDA